MDNSWYVFFISTGIIKRCNFLKIKMGSNPKKQGFSKAVIEGNPVFF